MLLKIYFLNIHNTGADGAAYLRHCAEIRAKAFKPVLQYKALNNYLLQYYKTSLQQCCQKLVKQSRINFNNADNVYYITFPKNLDPLAELITYGNLEVKGCSILKEIFRPIV